MKTENWKTQFRVLIWILLALFLSLSGAVLAAQEQVVPVVDGHLGQCEADFTVTDKDDNPIYDAKIDVTFSHGFFRLRKMSLQVGTNSDGKARVIGLPDKAKKTFKFIVSFGALSDTVLMDTSEGCKASFNVVLKE